MLEECAVPYVVHSIDITRGEQFRPEFTDIAPNSKIPAIVDDEAGGGTIKLFESGAILIYLADRFGKFLPREGADRYRVLQWLMFQMAGVGPVFGQAHHFLRFAAEAVPYAVERFTKETARLYAVLDRQLAGGDYIAGDYSIADMATFPWVARHEWHAVELARFPNVQRWFESVGSRPAVQRGMKVPA